MIIFTPTERTEGAKKENKLILISHRGNLDGKQPHKENHPNYIQEAINKGYDVEVDFWYHEDKFWLGHDEPQHEVELQWVVDRVFKLWIHCKDLKTLEKLKQLENQGFEFNYFFLGSVFFSFSLLSSEPFINFSASFIVPLSNSQ